MASGGELCSRILRSSVCRYSGGSADCDSLRTPVLRDVQGLDMSVAHKEDATLRQPEVAQARLPLEWIYGAGVVMHNARSAGVHHPCHTRTGSKPLAVWDCACETHFATLQERPSQCTDARQ